MNQKLNDMLEKTFNDLKARHAKVPLVSLKASLPKEPARPFKEALAHPKNGMLAIIAEVKLASPSAGKLGSANELADRARQYEAGGADALSIVTEKHFFKGDPAFVQEAKGAVSLPVLMKDFVLDTYQLYEARLAGADAVLLIARIVPPSLLPTLVEEALLIGLEPVVEVHDERDLASALSTKTGVIAVNARDLDTFEIDVAKACRLLLTVPDRFLRLGFSGVAGKLEAREYQAVGAQGILVGTALMKSADPAEFLRTLV
jgi:indole-3-glycerol phosphate synthase